MAEGCLLPGNLIGVQSGPGSIGRRPPRSFLEAAVEAPQAETEEGASGGLDVEYRRHDLVRIDPAAWAKLLAARSDLEGVPHLAGWAEAGWPLIVRRFAPGEARSHVPLGLPLPPADGKRRIGLALQATVLTPYAVPPLDGAAAVAPPTWRPTLDALREHGSRFGLAPRLFGSLLWQAVTGLTYLAETSDLDLLWPLPDAAPPDGLLADLAQIAAEAPMRLDGELLLPDGTGIHWRELLEAPTNGDVLAKRIDRLELRPVAGLRARAAA